jgi:hypothetical protein
MSSQFVFNQYYIDLLKRLKSTSKKYKESNELQKIELGRKILKSIRENYITLDKSSDEYVKYVNTLPEEFWKSYLSIEDLDTADAWFSKDDIKIVELYDKITIEMVYDILKDDYLCHHFITVFYIFKHELDSEALTTVVKVLQGTDQDINIDNITDENHKKLLQRLQDMRLKKIKDKTNVDMKGIEDTTLGKLAKEILQDVDVEKIQKSINEKGDVLKAIGDPDSGFTELITSVSRKMANKISSGELKQDTLLQDAVKFASVMPGLFGNNTAGSSDKPSGMPDMANMMNMMSSMMGNKDNMDMFKNFAANMKAPKGSKPSFNNSAARKMATAKKLKAKLHKKRDAEDEEN